MKLKIQNKEEYIELDGTIKKIKNKFFIEIEVPINLKLDMIITNIKGYYNSIGNITLVNNKNISVKGSQSNPESYIYEYKAGYVISGHINEEEIQIKSILLYFKELDYFFVEDEYKINTEKMNEELSITQRYKKEELLKNKKILINYNRMAGIDHDDAGHTLFLNPAKLEVVFVNSIKLYQVCDEISKIENCFGFIIGRKMNLIEVNVLDATGIFHDLMLQFQKDYNEVILNEFSIVDLNSKQLLKDILKEYYSNDHIAATINMFYEYIYNDLDNIFEFTSLVNTLELVLNDKKYKGDIKKYVLANNEELINNNNKMNEIFKNMSEEQQKFIKKFYNFENVELKDKFKYIFYQIFELKKSSESEDYISKVVRTRNYYVHGTERKNILESVNMAYTKLLLRKMLYILIVEVCSDETNCKIDSYKLTMSAIYKKIIENIKNRCE